MSLILLKLLHQSSIYCLYYQSGRCKKSGAQNVSKNQYEEYRENRYQINRKTGPPRYIAKPIPRVKRKSISINLYTKSQQSIEIMICRSHLALESPNGVHLACTVNHEIYQQRLVLETDCLICSNEIYILLGMQAPP